jgi:hypothetical protein
MLRLDPNPTLSEPMQKPVFIDFLQMSAAKKVVQVKAGLANDVAKSVNIVVHPRLLLELIQNTEEFLPQKGTKGAKGLLSEEWLS